MKNNFSKNYYKLERVVKGFANHRRIEILEILRNKPELSLINISEILNINFRTASDHIKKLAISGLVLKRSDGLNVRHKLTDKGLSVLNFLKKLN